MVKSTHSPIQMPLPIEGATIEIPLTKGYTTLVDAIDADLSQYKWHASVTRRGSVYAERFDNRKKTYLHRIVLERKMGRALDKNEFTDHVNGDTLLNTRDNIRPATPLENCRNKGIRSDSGTGIKGVHFYKAYQKWTSYIRVRGKQINLGYYDTPEEAQAAYQKAALEHFGEFARLE